MNRVSDDMQRPWDAGAACRRSTIRPRRLRPKESGFRRPGLAQSAPRSFAGRIIGPNSTQIEHLYEPQTRQFRTQVSRSLETAQALLGHSDLETTLNVYLHAVPEAPRSAVNRVAGVLFSDVPKLGPNSKESGRNNKRNWFDLRRIVVSRAGLEPATR
jgi:hypothetical protein